MITDAFHSDSHNLSLVKRHPIVMRVTVGAKLEQNLSAILFHNKALFWTE